jgi:hypothetical protein
LLKSDYTEIRLNSTSITLYLKNKMNKRERRKEGRKEGMKEKERGGEEERQKERRQALDLFPQHTILTRK